MEIAEIVNHSGDPIYYFAKGHVPKKDFMRAVRDYVELNYGVMDETLKGASRTRWRWWRALPDRTGEFGWKRQDAKAKARGAFRVTCVETSL